MNERHLTHVAIASIAPAIQPARMYIIGGPSSLLPSITLWREAKDTTALLYK